MKNLLCLLFVGLPLSVCAMEDLADNISNGDPARTVLPLINKIDESHLDTLSTAFIKTFKTLETLKLVHFPFTGEQAAIICHQLTTVNDIAQIEWEISTAPRTADISSLSPIFPLVPFLQFYRDLQSLKVPKGTLNISSKLAPTTEDWRPYITPLHSYVVKFQGIQPTYTLESLTKRQTWNQTLQKISFHGEALKKSLASLENITTWNWLEMRFHLHKLGNNFDLLLKQQNQLGNFEPKNYVSLFPKSGNDLEKLILLIKAKAKTLMEEINLPIHDSNKTTADVPINLKLPDPSHNNHRQTLKILFHELASLNLWNELKETTDNISVLHFWRLYCDLHKNYLNQEFTSLTSAYKWNIRKLTTLCEKLFVSSQHQITESIVSLLVNQNQGADFFQKIFECFKNPFDPQLYEVMAFEYHKSQLFEALRNLSLPAEKSASSWKMNLSRFW